MSQGGTTRANYAYLYDGTKLRAVNGAEQGFDYLGSLVYNRNGASSSLESAAFAAGRIIKTSTGYEVRYFLTDHLGSVRASVNQAGQVTDRSDYQLLGERWSGAGVEATTNRYQFNGKESQTLLSDANGISNFLDYGARNYNANVGRWFTPDPLSGQYLNLSPYNYCAANPIKYIDLDGREIWIGSVVNGKPKTQVYTPGMRPNARTGKEGASLIRNLNSIYSSGGKMLMNDLKASSNRFVMSTENSKYAASFSSDKSGGGTIKAGGVTDNNKVNISAFAHELMHAAQENEGQGGGPYVRNEVEAYVFGKVVAENFDADPANEMTIGNGSSDGDSYEDAFNSLVTNGYDEINFSIAVIQFQTGAEVGDSNEYKSIRVSEPRKVYKNLLEKYLTKK